MLGGGGYTMRNVSRAWAFETGLAAGVELGSGKFGSSPYMIIIMNLDCSQISQLMSTTNTLGPITNLMYGRRIWRT